MVCIYKILKLFHLTDSAFSFRFLHNSVGFSWSGLFYLRFFVIAKSPDDSFTLVIHTQTGDNQTTNPKNKVACVCAAIA